MENLETILIDNRIGLIILDSIASLARKDTFDASGSMEMGPSASKAGEPSGFRGGGGRGDGRAGETAARANALTAQVRQSEQPK